MGPQLYRCGNLAIFHAFTHLTHASMGPQLYRCGNGAIRTGVYRQWPSFNGAATLSLRKYYQSPYTRYYSTRFNGAATLSLRKSPTGSGPCCGASSFNGAATLSLRKFVPRERCSHCNTSFNGAATLSLRKCEEFQQQTSTYKALQWGRSFIVAEMRPRTRRPQRTSSGFNGAATLSLRKCRGGSHGPFFPLPLQWGRNFIVAEISRSSFSVDVNCRASMGPQLYHCGNLEEQL